MLGCAIFFFFFIDLELEIKFRSVAVRFTGNLSNSWMWVVMLLPPPRRAAGASGRLIHVKMTPHSQPPRSWSQILNPNAEGIPYRFFPALQSLLMASRSPGVHVLSLCHYSAIGAGLACLYQKVKPSDLELRKDHPASLVDSIDRGENFMNSKWNRCIKLNAFCAK